MNVFTKPCGCKGTGLLQSTVSLITLRKLWVREIEETDDPLGDDKLAECGSCLHGKFPTYTSTEIIEIQEERKTVDIENWVETVFTKYILYGCLKCGETWREKYESNTNRDWKGDNQE